MSVIWEPEFEHKHIVVVGDVLSFVEMVKQGIAVYKDRLSGRNGQAKAIGKVKKGLTAGGNTLVIVNRGTFDAMTAWVEEKGVNGAKKGTNEIPVRSGAIVKSKDVVSGNTVGVGGGTIHVGIHVHGTEKRVYHMQGNTLDNAAYKAEDLIERHELLRGLLGGSGVSAAPHTPGHVPDKLIKIIDGFCHGI